MKSIDKLPHALSVTFVMILVSGCTGGDTVSPGPSPTLPPADLSDEEAFARIPLDGTDASPLSWELPDVEDTDVGATLLTAQRFRALDYHTNSQPTEADAYLYQWVATSRMIDIDYPDGLLDPSQPTVRPARGPVWLWVVEVERTSPNGVVVHMCEDHGWRGAADGSEELPSANRAFLWHFEVVEQEPLDGETRWLVNRVWADRDLLGPDVRHECEEWAVHEPEKDG